MVQGQQAPLPAFSVPQRSYEDKLEDLRRAYANCTRAPGAKLPRCFLRSANKFTQAQHNHVLYGA